MTRGASTETAPNPGEDPSTLSYLQVLVAHLVVGGTALFLLALRLTASRLPGGILLVLCGACIVLALPRAAAWSRLDRHEKVSLTVLLALGVLFGAVGLAAFG